MVRKSTSEAALSRKNSKSERRSSGMKLLSIFSRRKDRLSLKSDEPKPTNSLEDKLREDIKTFESRLMESKIALEELKLVKNRQNDELEIQLLKTKMAEEVLLQENQGHIPESLKDRRTSKGPLEILRSIKDDYERYKTDGTLSTEMVADFEPANGSAKPQKLQEAFQKDPLQMHIDELKNEIMTLEKQDAEKFAEVQRLQNMLQEAQQLIQLQSKQKLFPAQLKALKSINEDTSSLDHLNDEIASLQSRIIELQTVAEIGKMEANVEVQNQTDQLQAQVSTLVEENQMFQTKRAQARTIDQNLIEKQAENQKQIEELLFEKQKLLETVTELREERVELLDKLVESKDEHEDLEEQLRIAQEAERLKKKQSSSSLGRLKTCPLRQSRSAFLVQPGVLPSENQSPSVSQTLSNLVRSLEQERDINFVSGESRSNLDACYKNVLDALKSAEILIDTLKSDKRKLMEKIWQIESQPNLSLESLRSLSTSFLSLDNSLGESTMSSTASLKITDEVAKERGRTGVAWSWM